MKQIRLFGIFLATILIQNFAIAQCTLSGTYTNTSQFQNALNTAAGAPNNCTTITLTGTAQYSGSVTVPSTAKLVIAGTATLNGTGTLTSTNNITIQVGGTLITNNNNIIINGTTLSNLGTITGPVNITPGGVLPVTLVSFDGTVSGRKVLLSWATATESNSKGFYIERSTDANSFTEIGFVSSTSASSSVMRSYTFTDASANPGKLFYRLRQVDLDGKYSYSNIIPLTMTTDVLTLYPNPTKGFVTFTQKIAENSTVSISNSVGIIVKQKVINNGINLSAFAPGVYYIRIDNVQNQKLTVVVQ